MEKEFVKRSLWSRGYGVKDTSKLKVGYDLLVSDKYRVKVVSGDKIPKLDGSKFDVLCYFYSNPLGHRAYYLTGKLSEIQGKQVDEELIKEFFTSKPQLILKN